MHERVAWLAKSLQEYRPRDDLRTVAQARVVYSKYLDARNALTDGRGVVLGLIISECAQEAVEVLTPLLGRLTDEWEHFLRARFGEKAVREMRIVGGERPSFEAWLGMTEETMDEALRGATRAALDLRFTIVERSELQATADYLGVLIEPRGQHRRIEPPYCLRGRVLTSRELEGLWHWGRDAVAARASLSSLGVRIALTGSPERQWPFVVAAFSDLPPRRIRFAVSAARFDRGPEPGVCDCDVFLAEGAGLSIAANIHDLDPSEETRRALHRWAATLAEASGARFETVQRG
jgi:hypothetical protein